MSLVPMFSMSNVLRYAEQFADDRMQEIIWAAADIGEGIINDAREFGNYMDVTGNLRSSLGYDVFINGQGKVGGQGVQGEKQEGRVNARQTLDTVAAEEVGNGSALVCVAGMEYAGPLESKGRTVLTDFTPFTPEEFNREMKDRLE